MQFDNWKGSCFIIILFNKSTKTIYNTKAEFKGIIISRRLEFNNEKWFGLYN